MSPLDQLTQAFLTGWIGPDAARDKLRALGYFEEEAEAIVDAWQDDRLHLRMTRLLDGLGDAA